VVPVTPRPYISVVTPSLNQGRYLQEATRSVANQQYANCEHIVVDALSTDETLDVLKAHEDSSSLRWISEADRGQSHALNKGVRLARGDWILWLNADDALADGALDAFVDAINRHPDVDVVYGHQQFVDGEGIAIKTVYHVPFRYHLIRDTRYVPPSTGSLFRRSRLLEAPLREDLHYVMDKEWFLRTGPTLRAVRVDAVVSAFRVTADSKTGATVLGMGENPRQVREAELLTKEYGARSTIPSPTEDVGAWARSVVAHGAYYALKSRHALRYVANATHRLTAPRGRGG
jgi:glycosyltransferase involved in cell wall biosynthesis